MKINKDKNQKEIWIGIGKSILLKYCEYANQKFIDDEEEFFPTLKAIIKGITESYKGSKSESDSIECVLIECVKENYVNTWIENAKGNEESPNIERETKDALKKFKYFYNQKNI